MGIFLPQLEETAAEVQGALPAASGSGSQAGSQQGVEHRSGSLSLNLLALS